MVIEADPRDVECAMQLGYSIYHFNDLNQYYQLWDARSNPVPDPSQRGHRHFLGEVETEAAAWALCPRFHSSMDACQEILERVREADPSHRALYLNTLRLQPELTGVSGDELLLCATPAAIAAAFVYVGKLRAWRPPRAREGFGDPDAG